jgi:hypothetical protein
MITVGVIGTAGRGEAGKVLSLGHWRWMCEDFRRRLEELGEKEEIVLVSGGAAWADHLAIAAMLDLVVSGVTVFAPCAWDLENEQYYDTGETDSYDWVTNPGPTANYYHELFSRVVGFDSLKQLDRLVKEELRFVYHPGNGFHERNGRIAEGCDVLLAYTLGTGSQPNDGGTLDTWKRAYRKCKRTHITIQSLDESHGT